jgi:hypothetical protein
MKFKESKVLVQLDDLISKKIAKAYIEDLADDVWDEGAESVIDDLYLGQETDVFAKYIKKEIQLSEDLQGALDEIYYHCIQHLKAKILSIILVGVYDVESKKEIKDERISSIDTLIDVYISRRFSRDVENLTEERMETHNMSRSDAYDEVYDTMKATHIAYLLKEAINFDPSIIKTYR